MDLSGRRVMVIGLGKTGVATARFLAERGSHVLIADEKPASELGDAIRALGDLNVELELGKNDPHILSHIDIVVPSPGVPPFNYLLAGARKKEIPILSEIELAYRFIRKPIIAITGTNGKTTTTKLIGHMLLQSGKKTFVGGNIGNPLIDFVNGKQEEDYLVLEISSFQLLWTHLFRPQISVLLNISNDHLDYHKTFQEYRAAKEMLFANQAEGDLAVLNAGDPYSGDLSKKIMAGVKYFSSSSTLEEGIFIDDTALRYRDHKGRDEEYALENIRLRGKHNLENIMASILVSRQCGCPPDRIKKTLEVFESLPHRMEFIEEVDGVEFYNDSKGTNIDAVKRALEAFSRPVILLLGGRNKGGDFKVLSRLIRERVKELVLFGEARKEINELVGGIVKTKIAEKLGESTYLAWKDSSAGDVVLLSPGCASFDEFANYEERGSFFKDLVRGIKEQGTR